MYFNCIANILQPLCNSKYVKVNTAELKAELFVTHFGLSIFIYVKVSNDYFLMSYLSSTEIASKSIRGIHLYFVSYLR